MATSKDGIQLEVLPTDDVEHNPGCMQEFVDVHVGTKNAQSLRREDRQHDLWAELDDASFDILAVR